ncbi:ATP-binding protein [Streptomyces camelliae]|uniref:ATP-binding protein n=2 Tax=Streptomyces camelliae TaxID=3004093 RepID=A0ABY7PJM1_9ACTN|nr:ATP-binding protein [Streptomyces sp. HUAS 2-6]WBO69356.1 ATP-binding protein [Streptomyces sp. HUAS 2-6]
MDCSACTPRKPWDLPFLAEPEEVAALRRVLRIHLGLWGLSELTEAAQLCLSELVSNVITHVGRGTPTTLAVSMSGTRLRMEIHDPDTKALPALDKAAEDAETGRGMALVAAHSDHWGVQLLPDRKVTWVELATALNAPDGHSRNVHVSRAESVLRGYDKQQAVGPERSSRLSATAAEETAIEAIADLLHWLRAHGRDADEALDRAQAQFEADAERTAR